MIHIAREYRSTINAEMLTRRVQWNGGEHLVVPVVMLQEGIVEGELSTGPEFISADELNPRPWNGRPVTYYHPTATDSYSANNPDTYARIAIGYIWHAKVEDNKLKAEMWFDLEKAKTLGDEIYDDVITLETPGAMMNVSTGYWAIQYEEPGTYNGQPYTWVTRNIEPDHLAILPDMIGACSWADGCGAPRANAITVREEEYVTSESRQAMQRLRTINTRLYLTSTPSNNADGIKETLYAVDDALHALLGYDYWINEVYDDRVVYTRTEYITESRPYTITPTGTVSLGEPTQVEARYTVEYAPVVNTQQDRQPDSSPGMSTPHAHASDCRCGGGKQMSDKKQMLINQIASTRRLNEAQTQSLETLDEALLEALAATPAPHPAAEQPAEPAPQQFDEDDLITRLEQRQQRKALLAKLNESKILNSEDMEALAAAPLSTLQVLASRLTAANQTDYALAAGSFGFAANAANNNGDDERAARILQGPLWSKPQSAQAKN